MVNRKGRVRQLSLNAYHSANGNDNGSAEFSNVAAAARFVNDRELRVLRHRRRMSFFPESRSEEVRYSLNEFALRASAVPGGSNNPELFMFRVTTFQYHPNRILKRIQVSNALPTSKMITLRTKSCLKH